MLIRVAKDIEPRLEDADNFREFKVVAAGGRNALAVLQEKFASAGRMENDQHCWVNPDWICAQVPEGDEPAWQAGFQKMLDFARNKGWVDPQDGTIRAHIEWAE